MDHYKITRCKYVNSLAPHTHTHTQIYKLLTLSFDQLQNQRIPNFDTKYSLTYKSSINLLFSNMNRLRLLCAMHVSSSGLFLTRRISRFLHSFQFVNVTTSSYIFQFWMQHEFHQKLSLISFCHFFIILLRYSVVLFLSILTYSIAIMFILCIRFYAVDQNHSLKAWSIRITRRIYAFCSFVFIAIHSILWMLVGLCFCVIKIWTNVKWEREETEWSTHRNMWTNNDKRSRKYFWLIESGGGIMGQHSRIVDKKHFICEFHLFLAMAIFLKPPIFIYYWLKSVPVPVQCDYIKHRIIPTIWRKNEAKIFKTIKQCSIHIGLLSIRARTVIGPV